MDEFMTKGIQKKNLSAVKFQLRLKSSKEKINILFACQLEYTY